MKQTKNRKRKNTRSNILGIGRKKITEQGLKSKHLLEKQKLGKLNTSTSFKMMWGKDKEENNMRLMSR